MILIASPLYKFIPYPDRTSRIGEMEVIMINFFASLLMNKIHDNQLKIKFFNQATLNRNIFYFEKTKFR